MRKIQFRGKELHTGIWVNGFYSEGGIIEPKTNVIIPRHLIHANVLYDVDPATVGQFIGICDKHHKRIFEGDIVKRICKDGYDRNEYGKVVFIKTCFMLNLRVAEYDNSRRSRIYQDEEDSTVSFINGDILGGQSPVEEEYEYEIVGNIYDNPELLKV